MATDFRPSALAREPCWDPLLPKLLSGLALVALLVVRFAPLAGAVGRFERIYPFVTVELLRNAGIRPSERQKWDCR
jgi:hypothetical protein